METELLIDLAKPILAAVMSGQWAAGAALALVLLVAATRKYGAKRFPVLKTDEGAAALTLVGSFGGALATALLAGSAPSLALAWTAATIAAGAAGGYSLIRKFVAPMLRRLAAKMPGPLATVAGVLLDVALWAFENRGAVKKAEAAGDKAVAEKPATGAAGVVGEPKVFP